VVEPLQGYFDDVVFRIVSDADDRQPLRGDLVTKVKSCDLDLGLLPVKLLDSLSRAPRHPFLSIF
jgi:hypothetical protein